MAIQTKIGDIFAAKISQNTVKYIQYVANDITQLNSDVIRAFDSEYAANSEVNVDKILNDKIAFYAHCATEWGVKLGFWQQVAHSENIGNLENVYFRTPGDDDRRIEFSRNWWVWKIGEEMKQIGQLTGHLRYAEVGSVIPPDSIVIRLRTGKYDLVYPKIG